MSCSPHTADNASGDANSESKSSFCDGEAGDRSPPSYRLTRAVHLASLLSAADDAVEQARIACEAVVAEARRLDVLPSRRSVDDWDALRGAVQSYLDRSAQEVHLDATADSMLQDSFDIGPEDGDDAGERNERDEALASTSGSRASAALLPAEASVSQPARRDVSPATPCPLRREAVEWLHSPLKDAQYDAVLVSRALEKPSPKDYAALFQTETHFAGAAAGAGAAAAGDSVVGSSVQRPAAAKRARRAGRGSFGSGQEGQGGATSPNVHGASSRAALFQDLRTPSPQLRSPPVVRRDKQGVRVMRDSSGGLAVEEPAQSSETTEQGRDEA